MAVITMPDVVATGAGGFSYGQVRYDIEERSEATGDSNPRLLGPPRWRFGLRSKRAMNLRDAGEWEAMLLQLRGRFNHLAVYDLLRPQILGRMRGTTLLNATVAVGATSMVLKGAIGTINMLQRPRSFNLEPWTVSSATVTANTDDYGTSLAQADTITDTNAADGGIVFQDMPVPSDTLTRNASVHVKATSGGTSKTFCLALSYYGGVGISLDYVCIVNTDTGAVLSGSSPGATVQAAAVGWWRVSIAGANNASDHNTVRVAMHPAWANYNSGVQNIAATGSAVVWGAQLSEGATLQALESEAGFVFPGDWLQIGAGVGTSQLVKVIPGNTSRSTVNGTVTVFFEPPARYAYTADTPVAWDKPVAYCKVLNESLSWAAVPGGPAIDGFAVDLLEDWRP